MTYTHAVTSPIQRKNEGRKNFICVPATRIWTQAVPADHRSVTIESPCAVPGPDCCIDHVLKADAATRLRYTTSGSTSASISSHCPCAMRTCSRCREHMRACCEVGVSALRRHVQSRDMVYCGSDSVGDQPHEQRFATLKARPLTTSKVVAMERDLVHNSTQIGIAKSETFYCSRFTRLYFLAETSCQALRPR